MAFSPLPTNMEQAKAEILSWREMHKEKAEMLRKQAAEIERLRKDAGRYLWLAEYLVSTSNQYDDLIVEVSETSVEELNAAIDGAMHGITLHSDKSSFSGGAE